MSRQMTVEEDVLTYIAMISARNARIAALEAQLAEANAENARLVKDLDRKHEAYCIAHDQATENGQRLSAIEATPPAPKVTEARLLDAVASAIRNSEFVFGDERLTFKELMESAFGEDGQYAANAANIIVPQLAYRTLTAAQEAGKP